MVNLLGGGGFVSSIDQILNIRITLLVSQTHTTGQELHSS